MTTLNGDNVDRENLLSELEARRARLQDEIEDLDKEIQDLREARP